MLSFGGSRLFRADHAYLMAAKASVTADPQSYTGWSIFIWAVFFCYVWFGSFKSGLIRFLFLLGLWLTLLALAIGSWGNLHVVVLLGGYLGLATSILAAIVSAIAVIGHGMKSGVPRTESAVE